MKILLDECTPHVLKRLLTKFEVSTVQELGWTGVKNGSLLHLAEELFNVLVTSDQNLKYQQNLSNRRLAVIQLPTNKVPVVVQLVPEIEESILTIKPGELIEIKLPDDVS